MTREEYDRAQMEHTIIGDHLDVLYHEGAEMSVIAPHEARLNELLKEMIAYETENDISVF